jgi:hypothetical protein
MGSSLGSLCALTLVVMESARIPATLSGFSHPRLMIFGFVLASSLLFAAGAGLTGLLFADPESD